MVEVRGHGVVADADRMRVARIARRDVTHRRLLRVGGIARARIGHADLALLRDLLFVRLGRRASDARGDYDDQDQADARHFDLQVFSL
jgi:hypothetical protein